jgi:hypothetical protein
MKFKYIGAGVEPPETALAYGITFTLNGDPVDVNDAHICAKLGGNPSFIVVDTEEPKEEKKKKAK